MNNIKRKKTYNFKNNTNIIKNEIWKNIPENLVGKNKWKISNYGRLKNSRNRIYYGIKLHKDSKVFKIKIYKKNYFVSRLVCSVFNKKPKNKNLVVNHINENTSDNRSVNLEWISTIDNNKFSHGIEIEEFKDNKLIKTYKCIKDLSLKLLIGEKTLSKKLKKKKNKNKK